MPMPTTVMNMKHTHAPVHFSTGIHTPFSPQVYKEALLKWTHPKLEGFRCLAVSAAQHTQLPEVHKRLQPAWQNPTPRENATTIFQLKCCSVANCALHRGGSRLCLGLNPRLKQSCTRMNCSLNNALLAYILRWHSHSGDWRLETDSRPPNQAEHRSNIKTHPTARAPVPVAGHDAPHLPPHCMPQTPPHTNPSYCQRPADTYPCLDHSVAPATACLNWPVPSAHSQVPRPRLHA